MVASDIQVFVALCNIFTLKYGCLACSGNEQVLQFSVRDNPVRDGSPI